MRISHKDMINKLYEIHKDNFSKEDIGRIASRFWSTIKSELNKGSKVTIDGFGSFQMTNFLKKSFLKKEEDRIKSRKISQAKCMAKYNNKLNYWRELAEYNQWIIVNGHNPHDRLPMSKPGRKSNLTYISHNFKD